MKKNLRRKAKNLNDFRVFREKYFILFAFRIEKSPIFAGLSRRVHTRVRTRAIINKDENEYEQSIYIYPDPRPADDWRRSDGTSYR